MIKLEPSVKFSVVPSGTVTSPGRVRFPITRPFSLLIKALFEILFSKVSSPVVLIQEPETEVVPLDNIPSIPSFPAASTALFSLLTFVGEKIAISLLDTAFTELPEISTPSFPRIAGQCPEAFTSEPFVIVTATGEKMPASPGRLSVYRAIRNCNSVCSIQSRVGRRAFCFCIYFCAV